MKPNKFTATLILVGALLTGAACGIGSASNALTLNYADTTNDSLEVKSGYYYPGTKTFTGISGPGSTSQSTVYHIYLADFMLDPSSGTRTLEAKLTSAGETKISFTLTGEEGTNKDVALKTGSYSPEAKHFLKVENVSIRVSEGGKEVRHIFSDSKMTGGVKVTSVSEESISGEIDLVEGDKAIKGSFTADVYKKS